jgi:hypothetical protein
VNPVTLLYPATNKSKEKKMKFSKVLLVFIVISFTIFNIFTSAAYAIPKKMNYQGYITSTEKIPLNDVSIKITFKFYDALTGGNVLWTEEHQSVPVNQGIYNVILGKKESLDKIILSNKLYLGISIENDPEMTPREEVSSVLFSFRAAVAATVDIGAIKTEHLADNCVTSSKLANHSVTADKFADKVMIADQQGNTEQDGMINFTGFKPNYSPLSTTTHSGSLYSVLDGVNFNSDSTLIHNILLNFKLDESKGNVIKDSVSLNNGVAHNEPLIVPGKINNARDFDSTKDQYISKELDSLLDFGTGSFTISFWLKADPPEDWSVVMSKANDWGDDNSFFGWIFGNAGGKNGTQLEFTINSGNTGDKNNHVIHADNVFNGQWHHIVGMRDENSTMHLFVDGQSKGNIQHVTQTVNSESPFLLGKLIVDATDNSVNYNYSGLVDEVAIWDRALKASEISELFYNAKGIPSTDSKLYYQNNNQNNYDLTGILKKTSQVACDESIEGVMRYNVVEKYMEYCNGSQWKPTFAMESDGQTKYTAGRSCKTLLDTGYSKGDGVYWIDPDGDHNHSNAFQVYCDMTTDGGGWTQIAYKSDLEHKSHFEGNDAWRWLDSNFKTVLTDEQIKSIQLISTEGKQRYIGTCQYVIHYLWQGAYGNSFGFKFLNGEVSEEVAKQYTTNNISVVKDGCQYNDGEQRETWFDIYDKRVPVINVYSWDNGDTNEMFGSPLTSNPAWLR